ncbi:MAG TPA: hypothetical protein VH207_13005, partial [Chthoniobacterales bacterium]|nr:hypothetical protein [Chthoniobacterales bacterium]
MSQIEATLPRQSFIDLVYNWMLRCAFFVLLLFLSACAMITSGPRLSQADVRRIADAEVRPKVDLRQYEISGLHYVRRGGFWSVSYRRKTETREGFTVRVADKI